MQLLSAILLTLCKSALIITGLMAILFVGYLLFAEAGPTVRDFLDAPDRLHELEGATRENVEAIATRQAESVAHTARQRALSIRLEDERTAWQDQLESELQAIEEASVEQLQRVRRTIDDNRRSVGDSIRRVESEYCESWNPIDWWTCRAVRKRVEAFDEGAALQRQLVEDTARRFEERAQLQAREHRELATQRLEEQTAELQEQLQASLTAIEDLEQERLALEERARQIQDEEALLRQKNWLWLEFRKRWPHLLFIAILIFAAPFIRRTLWYFVGMPLVSRAKPIQLERNETKGQIQCGKSHRTLEVEVPAGRRLLARPGYIQSDRQGAKSELFFDRRAPNLSYMSGLVLLTRLEGRKPEDEARKVMLGTPDDPDAYLMRVELDDHPGIVLRASHVVALVGDIRIRSTWRLSNLHAWATSQVRFIIFSGTGTLILEGYGDVHGKNLEEGVEEKRMPLVLGFDTRLTYQTRRSATFLPYLVDPGREPLVVDVFEGTGTVFFEKNPTARTRHRTAGEAIAGFFLDAIRRLLGI